MRLEPPINGTFRLSRTPTTVRDTEIPAGSTVMILPSGANRDPREFEHPDELRLDRENARQHIAFGHGIHTCAGAPLARAESNVSLQRLLDRMADIRISERTTARPETVTGSTRPPGCSGATTGSTSSSPPSTEPGGPMRCSRGERLLLSCSRTRSDAAMPPSGPRGRRGTHGTEGVRCGSS